MIKKKNHILSSLFLGLLGGCITTIAIFLSIASSNFYSNLKLIISEDSVLTIIFVLASCCFFFIAFRHAKNNDFKELCDTYPNGIIKWLRKNELYYNHIKYNTKIKALNSIKEICSEEQSVIDEYHEIKENCPHVFSRYQKKYGEMLKTCDIRKEIEQKEKEWQIKEKKRKDIAKSNIFKNKYPNGLNIFIKLNSHNCLYDSTQIANIDEKELIKLEKEYSSFQKWHKEQNTFSSLCWQTAHDSFPNLGRYKYPIYLPSFNKNYEVTTQECTVWQIFTDCFCGDNKINYTYYKWVYDNFEKTKKIDDKYIRQNVNKIADFIKKIDKEVSVVICPGDGDLLDDANISFMSYLMAKLTETNCELKVYGAAPTKKHIIIVEAITSNSLLKEHCQEMISKYSSLSPCLCYISLMKGYDTDEMQALIDKKKKEEEGKEKEKQKIATVHKMIGEAVQKWDTIFMGFQAISMLDYYPTTSKVTETSDIWNDRRMVWNFKNNPEKVYDDENAKAVEWATLQAKEIIETTFGKENAKYITFVCIPASSQEMTERRYKTFSEKLCKATGMIDAFNHIKVSHAKTEKHTGGSSFSQDMLEYDKDFFKDKYVLLFDDVITTGSSMRSFKSKLQEFGSLVIGGMSIGRTKDKYNEHNERIALDSLGIKLIPKPLFTKGGKPQPHKVGIPKNPFGISLEQEETSSEQRVGYNKAPIYNDMPLNTYPAIRFPEKGCIVFPYRTGKQFRRGYTEQLFEDFIKSHLPNSFSIIGNAKILLGDECRPYEPDIAIIASSNKNIRIDIEIDEPYNGVTREPTHFIGCGDEFRDLNIVNAGWIVMRFPEEQIFCEKEKCLNEIYRLLWSLDSNYVFEILDFDRNIHLGIKPYWTELDAKMMAAANFRENYLQHNFGNEEVALSKQEYLKQTEEEKVIAKQIKCIPQLRAQNQNNIDNTKLSFVQDKDIEFFAKEHIYVYKKFIQLKAVSDVISMFFRKFDSIGWSRKKALENGISQRCQLEQWDCKGAESREVGTYLHEQIHKHFIRETPDFTYHFQYNGEEVHVDKKVDISREYTYFKKFLNEENIIPFRTEWQIFDPVLRIAGTIDFLSRNDSEFDLYDWKRSDKIDRNATVWNYGINGLESVPDTRYYHYCLQLNMYKYILEKNYNIAINKMYLVVLHPVYNTYQKIEVPTMTNVVNSIIGYYQTIA